MQGKSSGSSQRAPTQRLPAGQFNHEGLSQGKATGPVRTTHDAYQGSRSKGETPPKPGK